MTKKHKMWLAGGVLGAVVVGGLVWAASAKAAPAIPAGPAPVYSPATTLTTGKTYGIAAQLPPLAQFPGAAYNPNNLTQMLNAAGWKNVQIIFFGPSGGTPAGNLPVAVPGAAATTYVASGTWSGQNGAAVPAGVSAVQVS